MVRTSEAGTAVTSDGVNSGLANPRVVMQTPPSLGTPTTASTKLSSEESTATDRPHQFHHNPQFQHHHHHHQQQQQQQQLTLSCNPLLLPPSMSVGSVGPYDHSSQTLSVTGYNQSNGVPLTGGPLKRTIVHKYHSFRKILPKSPEHFMQTATLHTIPNLGSTSPGLTQLPVLGTSGGGAPGAASTGMRVYRNASFPQSNLLSCDTASETAYFVDIPANLTDISSGSSCTMGHSASLGFQAYASVTATTNTTTTAAVSSPLVNNPASQLLKSLLEKGDGKEATNTVLTIPVHPHHLAAVPAPKK
ncbi:unnamed protein product, partial [Echinostoma caproni]|uniref:Fork-head domain-containing protein n=1 Tax=Echinostoma caproni TaxID=27848 RepID=A0A183AMV2_9TREM